ncbi:MAG: ParB/RepB/Spo0J family partition protein [Acidobacteria bacterium]|nr:ParB/RepB/Spo0J family partition protein [Acidobacteriota bacterium]
MAQKLHHSLRTIQSAQIDPQDRLFAISLPWVPLDPLLRSVRESGILSPLHVQPAGPGRFRIIIGFRRFEVARELGVQEIPCIVREEKSKLTLFVQALEDNLVSRPLHLLEKAHLLLKLRDEFGLSDQVLMDDFMSLLDIPVDRFHLQQYLSLARLPESLQRAILDPLEPEVALKMSSWESEEQELFQNLVSKFRLGRNKQKQLFALLDELRDSTALTPSGSGTRVSVPVLWERSGAAAIEVDQRLSLSDRFAKAFEVLYRERFPRLSSHEKEYERLKSALKLPPRIQFHAPRYFEGEKIDVSFAFQTSDELYETAQKLEEIAQSDEVREILELL